MKQLLIVFSFFLISSYAQAQQSTASEKPRKASRHEKNNPNHKSRADIDNTFRSSDHEVKQRLKMKRQMRRAARARNRDKRRRHGKR